MSNYNINLFNLPLDTLNNIQVFHPTTIDGVNIILIKADTLRKDTYTCDKCGSIHKHTIKEYKPILNKYLSFKIKGANHIVCPMLSVILHSRHNLKVKLLDMQF